MAAAHAVWKGFLEFFLVSAPVKAFSAAAPSGTAPRLSLLHADCLGPIKYARKCAVHGEVPPAEVVRGFDAGAGRYVLLDRSEMDSLRPSRSRRVRVENVVDPSQVPPHHYAGRTYYLAPDGPAAQRPYALLRDVLAEAGVAGFAQVSLHTRQRLVLLRPAGRLLTLSVLLYADQRVDPATFERELTDVRPSPDELRLGVELARKVTVPPERLADFRDPYAQGLAELIDAKVQDLTRDDSAAAPAAAGGEAPASLVEALRRSIELAAAKPPRIVAPTTSTDVDRSTDQTGSAGA